MAVALVPMLVLLDLAGGGDGWGLCRGGLTSCRAAYFEGPELLAALAVVLFLLRDAAPRGLVWAAPPARRGGSQ